MSSKGSVLASLQWCNLVCDPNVNKLMVEVLKEAIRKIKSSSTYKYAALRVGGNWPHFFDQVEAGLGLVICVQAMMLIICRDVPCFCVALCIASLV